MKSTADVLLIEAATGVCEPLCTRLNAAGLPCRRLEYSRSVQEEAIGHPDVAIVVVDANDRMRNLEHLSALLDQLGRSAVKTLVLGSEDRLCAPGGTHVQWLGPQTTLDEVMGRLTTLAHYEPLVRNLERELHHVQKLGEQLNRYFGEIDQEMRLAGRLQRDFLPRSLPERATARFAALYRPASWVSGDIYDVIQIDDEHIGVFIADAMGHGVAAGLLTMFLRQALVPRRLSGNAWEIVSPAEVVATLNECLVRQKLPNCQFITAAYATIHLPTRTVRLARAGHPYPILIRADGVTMEEVTPVGGLLGIGDLGDEYDEAELVLQAGEKLIFYTDGLEDTLLKTRTESAAVTEFSDVFRSWVDGSANEIVQGLTEHVDRQEGSLHPADDVTFLVVEATASPQIETQRASRTPSSYA